MVGKGNRGAVHIECFVYGYIWGCWMLHQLDECGDNNYIVVEDGVWMEKKWRTVRGQFDTWNTLLACVMRYGLYVVPY